MRRLLLIVLSLLAELPAQGTAADYQRAKDIRRQWSNKLDTFRPALRWLPNNSGVWWSERRGGKRRFVLVDTKTGARKTAATRAELDLPSGALELQPQASWGRSPRRNRQRTSITFVNKLDRRVRIFWSNRRGETEPYGELEPGASKQISTYAGHVWVLDFAANDLAGIFVAAADPARAILNAASRQKARGRAAKARRRSYRISARGHNLFGRGPNGREFQLTKDGNAADAYRTPRSWSPDGKKALGFRVAAATRRKIHMVESAPRGQVQPKLHSMSYEKPGDTRDRVRPRLFDLSRRRMVPVDETPFADAYRISRVHWAPDSSRVFCVYNQRGHQKVAVLAIDAKTGAVSTVVDERSKTFVDYSQKLYLHWLANGKELLWASERDGRNHIYRYGIDGRLRAQVTKGEFVVREVVHVDEAKGQLWFTALGIHAEQDPYHRHLARVDLDGRNLQVLTDGDGTHSWSFSPNREFFVARWSRVDQPTVTELRRASDGKRIAELGRDDAKRLLAAGFRPPQRFVAKGRDGTTDIHGILIRPSNFDPKKRYPVVEDIYAGPHSHHVPKTFGLSFRQRTIAELGFIVVRIDGMGTNWRTKAFHDVCWQNLKDAGFPDRIAWLRAAAKVHPELDLRKVGIFGGSAGGQNALSALLHHGDFYHAAVSDCGCHDNRMDKIWWNEAWMGRMGPHYAASSNVTHAGKLQGKLMLTVGELDRNVDPASTMQVVDALIRANKDFDLIVVPGGGHGVGERPYLVRRRQDFFVRHLLGVEPRHGS